MSDKSDLQQQNRLSLFELELLRRNFPKFLTFQSTKDDPNMFLRFKNGFLDLLLGRLQVPFIWKHFDKYPLQLESNFNQWPYPLANNEYFHQLLGNFFGLELVHHAPIIQDRRNEINGSNSHVFSHEYMIGNRDNNKNDNVMFDKFNKYSNIPFNSHDTLTLIPKPISILNKVHRYEDNLKPFNDSSAKKNDEGYQQLLSNFLDLRSVTLYDHNINKLKNKDDSLLGSGKPTTLSTNYLNAHSWRQLSHHQLEISYENQPTVSNKNLYSIVPPDKKILNEAGIENENIYPGIKVTSDLSKSQAERGEYEETQTNRARAFRPSKHFSDTNKNNSAFKADFAYPENSLDYSRIEIVSGRVANELVKNSNADALTIGSKILISDDMDILSPEGLGLLAHEITHVKQIKKIEGSSNLSLNEEINAKRDSLEQEALNKEQFVYDDASKIWKNESFEKNEQQQAITPREGLDILHTYVGVNELNMYTKNSDAESTKYKFSHDNTISSSNIFEKSNLQNTESYWVNIWHLNGGRSNDGRLFQTSLQSFPSNGLASYNTNPYALNQYSYQNSFEHLHPFSDNLIRNDDDTRVFHPVQNWADKPPSSSNPKLYDSIPDTTINHSAHKISPLFAKRDRNIQKDAVTESSSQNQEVSSGTPNTNDRDNTVLSQYMSQNIDNIVERVFQLLQNKIKIQKTRRGM